MIVKKYLWQIISFILFILLFIIPYNYTKIEVQSKYIPIPSKEGTFNTYKPIPIDLPNYIFIEGNDTIELENPINKELKDKYLQAEKENNNLKLKLLYYESIQMRKYHEIYEDKNITIDVFANTTGTLDSLGIKYKTKKDSIKIKTPIFRLLAGPQLQIINEQLYPGLSVGIQNQKGNIFEGSINSNKDILLGYKHNIWTIKK